MAAGVGVQLEPNRLLLLYERGGPASRGGSHHVLTLLLLRGKPPFYLGIGEPVRLHSRAAVYSALRMAATSAAAAVLPVRQQGLLQKPEAGQRKAHHQGKIALPATRVRWLCLPFRCCTSCCGGYTRAGRCCKRYGPMSLRGTSCCVLSSPSHDWELGWMEHQRRWEVVDAGHGYWIAKRRESVRE